MDSLPDVFAGMARKVEDVRRRERGREREGKVVAADPVRGLYRVDVGRDGSTFLTPWLPVQALSSGALRIQGEPVVGQLVRVTSPSGDLTDGIIALSSFDDNNPRPHDKAGELKIEVGDMTILGTADSLVLSVGGASITITDGDVAINGATAVTGASLTHNGKNVGDDHTHKDVASGTSNTGTPN